ncbi:3-oxoacyl-[acyl-carrier-protein] synthase 2 [Aquisalinus flavus]|uniref:3-oxoacyl-[acyl-carrier-protein] synthase 2 n=1 Tax=Aquisalinus flavus TaxID=1526572 RepID=A0A8J2Y7Q6_9PROT|nr:beta-ketoacyl-ACP synthase II [Aquisalinus flavus]MBD0427920.1 beta-ketoacyl-ACP synthase II [Aquisalinus flavus]UNE47677.1 beta-ketoacyl-ACP synthase II [Aquisalinus flavus]GGD04935.1 3-oxoacyl-[acyl-carrier-protein] synthase 2 [Aquisalinus flavus]
MLRRVVVTGLGLVTPLGAGVKGKGIDGVWQRILNGEAGANRIEKFDVSDLPCKIAAEIPQANGNGGGEAEGGELTFNPDDWVDAKERRRVDDFIVYGLAAADMALEDAGIELKTDAEKERAGAMIGSGIGGLNLIESTTIALHEKGPRRVSPFFIPGSLINLVSGQVSIRHGLKGPNHSVVTACATGVHAIGDAARLIQVGDADIMVAGGAEAPVCRLGIAGFAACKALTTGFNDTPKKASRPYDRDRDGFLMGEGSGIVVLEEYEHAKARGAKIYGEIVGYGLSGDAYHITAPAENGDGGYRAMKMALERAGMGTGDIDYVNAHGTSTPKGDEIELRAVERLFADDADGLVMSSTKSATGHLLGAAGAIEAIFSILAMRDNVAPPTINLDNPSVDTPINLAANAKVEKEINAVLSNSFGFGGTNASIIFRKV